MESRRIIKNRKTIIAFCIVLLFNGIWYYYQQQSHWKNYNYSICASSKIQKNYRMELDGMSLEAQLQLIANKKEKIEKSVRHQLVARRVLILFITSLVVQFILVAQRVILSSVMYGNPHVLRPIQSVPEFIRFVYPASILEYLILYCLICGLCCFCFGLLAWLFLSIFHNSILSIFVLSICTVIQWIIYFLIQYKVFLAFLNMQTFTFL